jgi:site-specific recombinase XerD
MGYCENDNGTVIAEANSPKVAKLATKWLKSLKGQAPASIARKSSAVCSYLRYCGLGEAAAEVYRPEIRNVKTTFLEPTEADKLLAHKKVTPRMRALLAVLSLSPLTLDQVINLTHKDLEMSAGVIRGPYYEEVREAIESYLAISLAATPKLRSAADARVFCNYYGAPLSRQAAWKEVRNAGHLLSPPRAVNCNHLKASYVTRVYREVGEVTRTAEICGLSEDIVRRLVNMLKARKAKANGK